MSALLCGRAVWWRWLRWVVVAVFIAAFIPSLFDRRFAWMWMVTWGVLAIGVGLVEVLAPMQFIEWRRTYLDQAPELEQRIGRRFDSRGPSVGLVRATGAMLCCSGAERTPLQEAPRVTVDLWTDGL